MSGFFGDDREGLSFPQVVAFACLLEKRAAKVEDSGLGAAAVELRQAANDLRRFIGEPVEDEEDV